MSGLLTNVVRRQALMMISRRCESELITNGPPVNKISKQDRLIGLALFMGVPMIYPIYIMSNLQKYNGSNRTWAKAKKPRASS